MINLRKPNYVTINDLPYEYTDCQILHIDIPARSSRLKPGAHRREESNVKHFSADFADNVLVLVFTLTDGMYLYVTTDWAVYLLDKAMEHGAAYRNRAEAKIWPHDKRCVEFYRTCKSAYLYGNSKHAAGDTRLASRTRHFRMPYMRLTGETADDVEGIEVVHSLSDLLALADECNAHDLFDPADDTGGRYHFKFGDVLGIPRTGYHHFGVYEGDDQVVHFSGQDGDFSSQNTIHEAPLSNFSPDIGSIEATEFPEVAGKPTVHTASGSGASSNAVEELIPQFIDALLAGRRAKSVNGYRIAGIGEAAASSLFNLQRTLGYHRYNPGQTVARAKSRITERGYALPFNNCEHLAVWCKTGLHESHQVNEYWGKVAEALIPNLGTLITGLLRKR